MYKKFEETFTSDLRYRNEITALEQDQLELLEEREPEQPLFTMEEINSIWVHLEHLYGKADERYILMYLVFYLGYSYRDAAAVLGIAVSWCHKLVEKSIVQLRGEFLKDEECTTE